MGGPAMNDKFNNIPLPVRFREEVTILQAAQILNNNNPYIGTASNSHGFEVDATIDLLIESVRNERIEMVEPEFDPELDLELRYGFMSDDDLIGSDSRLLTSSLAVWCDSVGMPHPFKAMSKKTTFEAQTPDLDLEKALAKIAKQEAEIETLNKKLELSISNHQHLHDEIVFPYSTPELVAMREAAIKFWVNLKDDSRPAFNQNTIALEIGELLELNSDNSGEPNRKALEYSRAIKPVEKRD